jgi:hypothetical protein
VIVWPIVAPLTALETEISTIGRLTIGLEREWTSARVVGVHSH